MTPITISALHTYPVKSCAGIASESLEIGPRGPALDRNWMIVGADDCIFLSQRSFPRMALIQPAMEADHLRLSAPGMDELRVPISGGGDKPVRARVWLDLCDGFDDGDAAAEWLTAFLRIRCRLVHMAEGYFREVDPKYSASPASAGFADAFPILLLSEASLENLNQKLASPVPMDRFRPNIVVRGCASHAEDTWKRIKIGGIEFDVAKPCVRCTITTIDQKTAEKCGPEPLQTLATYRKEAAGVMFGQNVINRGTGRLSVGDSIEFVSEL
ncbi:MOSC domain-containing protein [Candidatus Sumerlaeota bacterium]|nr:MOSC domain-containing protein [Candidatus Sumerlaeota bacterium]